MAKAVSKKKVEELESSLYSDARRYARQIWLAGLGTYAKVGQEGHEYFKDLVKAGESVEKKGRELVNTQIDAANDNVKGRLHSVKARLNLDRIEEAFDARVAAALNRIGIPSRRDVAALSAKLDELSEVLERVARTQ
ncbi:phasin family protein [Pseudomonas sp. MT3]|uniref:phasin family protein n=1 Tax=Pseudomonas sp. ATCC 13867 TaxID=1294143 RepID=UPI0002C4DFE9|nr:phasin family protein [Pseudomonas sp. ATCC 13867]AGI22284.1 poly(hydroxyalcanoate) granule associated protein [Pseudomonas sp. ATCC 13867]RFQ24221.1 poly(3-hydroxyalkanoate) granule-associated protein PhaI [Pseudomonas sp. ATCC 13867]